MRRYLILVALLIFFGIFVAARTLGLLETENNMSVNANLAKWSIKINNMSANNISTSFNVNTFSVISANNTAPNVFAPGSLAYFVVDFDVTDTEVSVMYDIEFDFSNITNKAIKIQSIQEMNGYDFTQIGFNKFAAIIPLSDMATNPSRIWEVDLIWEDQADNGVNDYNLGHATNRNLSIPVRVHAIQYTDGAESIWMNSKLQHIVDAALLYANDYYADEENSGDLQITVGDLITPVNYLNTIEQDDLDIISYYNYDKSVDLSDLELLIYQLNEENEACIKQNMNNRTLLDETFTFSNYMDLGYYCE